MHRLLIIIQYYFEIGQPQRTNFIGRELSFHGNTIGTLSLAKHPIRRAPYKDILDEKHFHHVSPAYAKRFQLEGESEEEYVERLRQELEDKFIALGPDTVIGCTLLVHVHDRLIFTLLRIQLLRRQYQALLLGVCPLRRVILLQ